jgi:hypothetical protein
MLALKGMEVVAEWTTLFGRTHKITGEAGTKAMRASAGPKFSSMRSHLVRLAIVCAVAHICVSSRPGEGHVRLAYLGTL